MGKPAFAMAAVCIFTPFALRLVRSQRPSEIGAQDQARQFDAQRELALGARALLEACELLLGPDIEITGREGRISLALAAEIAGDVAQIFPLQRQRVIFRMALEKHKMAAQLF